MSMHTVEAMPVKAAVKRPGSPRKRATESAAAKRERLSQMIDSLRVEIGELTASIKQTLRRVA